MKKKDLIVRVLTRVNPSKTEEQVRKEVDPILIKLNLDDWECPIPACIRNAILQNIGLNKRNNSFEYLIKKLDMILKREGL